MWRKTTGESVLPGLMALNASRPGSGWNWLGWIGVLPILTAVFGTCPAYALFGYSTR